MELYKNLLLKIKSDINESGKFGEAIAAKWLRHNNWSYIDFTITDRGDEEYLNMIDLYDQKGKKPDFLGQLDGIDGFVLWDAKFHRIYEDHFKLSTKEINKYSELLSYFNKTFQGVSFYIIFMFFPKEENGTTMYLVPLDDFLGNGTDSKFGKDPAVQVRVEKENCFNTSEFSEEVVGEFLRIRNRSN